MYVYIYIYTYIYIHIPIHIYVCIYIRINMYIYSHMHVCVPALYKACSTDEYVDCTDTVCNGILMMQKSIALTAYIYMCTYIHIYMFI